MGGDRGGDTEDGGVGGREGGGRERGREGWEGRTRDKGMGVFCSRGKACKGIVEKRFLADGQQAFIYGLICFHLLILTSYRITSYHHIIILYH